MPQRMCDPFKVLNVLEIFLGIFKLQKSSRWLLRNIPALLRQILLQAQLFWKKSQKNPEEIQNIFRKKKKKKIWKKSKSKEYSGSAANSAANSTSSPTFYLNQKSNFLVFLW